MQKIDCMLQQKGAQTAELVNLCPDQGIVSMRQVLRLDVERAKVGLLLALRLLLGLRECHLRHTWGYGWTAPHA